MDASQPDDRPSVASECCDILLHLFLFLVREKSKFGQRNSGKSERISHSKLRTNPDSLNGSRTPPHFEFLPNLRMRNAGVWKQLIKIRAKCSNTPTECSSKSCEFHPRSLFVREVFRQTFKDAPKIHVSSFIF